MKDNEIWEQFAGATVPVVNDRPDLFFCRVCHSTWASRAPANGKRGAVGFNRCSHCGTRYFAVDLVKLASAKDKTIKLLAEGAAVTVGRAHLPSLWQNFAGNPVNAILAQEQGVDLLTLPGPVAVRPVIPPATGERPGADAPRTSDLADWERFVRSVD